MSRLLLVLLVGYACAHPLLLTDDGYHHQRGVFGTHTYTKQTGPNSHHTVSYADSVEDQVSHIQDLLVQETLSNLRGVASRPVSKASEYGKTTITCEWGEGPNYFRIAPQFVGAVFKTSTEPIPIKTHCFQNTTMEYVSSDDDSITVRIKAEKPLDLTCYDSYWIATLNHIHIETVFFHGEHTVTLRGISAVDWVDIERHGVRLFRWCDNYDVLLEDLGMTLAMFLGGFSTNPDIPFFGSHTTKSMELNNRKFLNASIGYNMEPRSIYEPDFDYNVIQSGDFLAITRLDGLDEIIMLGTGGHVGHSTTAIWLNITGERELYIMESQAGWYWPRTGIQINPFKTWIEWARNASFNVIILPLKKEYADKYNETEAYEWFKTVEGQPYGYHNFMFGWIDTARDNFPPILSPDLLPIVMRLVEKVIPSAIESVFGQAMNKRLGTKGLEIPELAAGFIKKNSTILEAMAIPEQDGWVYSDGLSYVCSSFVAALYRHSGMLDEYVYQGTEMTPKDVTSLTIFDKNWTRPAACVEADPDLPYCQLIGEYRVRLGDYYSTIDPYDNMDERCPSIAPDFVRTPGC